jgi:glycosyltransferase involved in cell wall biosynthesis
MSGRSQPIVSVITPAYNAASYLSETIASVLTQTFGDLEVIIADDGSTDATLELAREWERVDPRVRTVSGPNGGSSVARNRAIRHARGSYFALLDSDDLWWPEFLAAQMAVFDERPDADVVTGNAYNFGGPFSGRPLNPPGPLRPLSLLEILSQECSVCIMSVFRRSVIERIGGFDETLRHNEDYDFWIRAAAAGCRFLTNPRPLAHYRRHPASKSADDVAAFNGITIVLQRAQQLCADRPAERAAIDRQLARFERARLFASAKNHLVRREFDAAAGFFQRLSAVSNDLTSSVLAGLCRCAPRTLLWGYRTKTTLRTLGRMRGRC